MSLARNNGSISMDNLQTSLFSLEVLSTTQSVSKKSLHSMICGLSRMVETLFFERDVAV